MGKNRSDIPRPRDMAGSFSIDEGTGPILVMCSLGDVMEVYKTDTCFEVLSPESVDPDDRVPDAPWILKSSTPYGAGNEIVARVFLQAQKVFSAGWLLPKHDTDSLLCIVRDIRNALLECSTVSGEMRNSEAAVVEGMPSIRQSRNVISSFPHSGLLRNRVGAYLMNAKDALQGVVVLFNTLFGTRISETHFQEVRQYCASTFPGSAISKLLDEKEPRTKWIVDLRNAYEHPRSKKLTITDFQYIAQTKTVIAPLWSLKGDKPTAITEDCIAITEFLVDFVEALVLLFVLHASGPVPLKVVTTSTVRPEIPIRYDIQPDMDFSKLGNQEQ